MTRQKGNIRELGKMIEQLKSLSYLMLPILRELEIAYKNKMIINNTWKHVPIDEMAELLRTVRKQKENLIRSSSGFVIYLIAVKTERGDMFDFVLDTEDMAAISVLDEGESL